MPVLNFAVRGTGNCLTVDGTPYVHASTQAGEFVLPARCPHRGGPLHLADVQDRGTRLVCPWHGRSVSVSRFVRAGVPSVRRGSVVTAVFPAGHDIRATTGHLPLSSALAGPR